MSWAAVIFAAKSPLFGKKTVVHREGESAVVSSRCTVDPFASRLPEEQGTGQGNNGRKPALFKSKYRCPSTAKDDVVHAPGAVDPAVQSAVGLAKSPVAHCR